jgi:glycine cleavage system aminomethyltransferase T
VRPTRWRYGPGVSVFAPSEGGSPPLAGVLRQAGAVFSSRDGQPVAIHYGSAAGELAVCVSAVGLVDRSDIAKLEIEASQASLDQLTARLAGGEVVPGGALYVSGAWWCRAGDERLLVLTEPADGRRLVERLRVHAMHQPVRRLRECSAELAAIGLLGPAADKVLRALGVYGRAGDPRLVTPLCQSNVAGFEVSWLLESDRSAIALVPRDHAHDVWRTIEVAGRPFGISCVGQEAAGRYALLERGRSRAVALVV